MPVRELDLLYLRFQLPDYCHIRNIPVDKKWLLNYCTKTEHDILFFYSLTQHLLVGSKKSAVLHLFQAFTGKRKHAKYFYDTIGKFDYLVYRMTHAINELDIETMALLNSGNFKIKRYVHEVSDKRITFEEALLKYPESVKAVESIIRKSQSRFKNEPMESFKWFLSDQTPNKVELICKRGTKLAIHFKIGDL